MALFKSMLI